MKLTYLKKFNEAYSDECSFDTFKEILYDLSDDYNCEFFDYSGEYDPFYDCIVTLPKPIDVEFPHDDNLTEYLPPYEEPMEVDEETLGELNTQIGEENKRIKELEGKLNLMIERNNKIKEIISNLETEIIPRLQSFSNCESVTIGYESSHFIAHTDEFEALLRICFDLPQED